MPDCMNCGRHYPLPPEEEDLDTGFCSSKCEYYYVDEEEEKEGEDE